ncbi:NADP-dependent oxidoreductase domain-containing protein [Xylariaceae sp. FL0594]|nr:NADP-dependent oxidoreductase domain-containing protein [Xylariaceae sp. FL0594]
MSTKPICAGPIGYGLMGLTWRAHQTVDEQAFAAMKAAVNRGATFWSSADFYGPPSDPLANVKLVRRYFERYPEDADKVTLYVKGCFEPARHAPNGSREFTRKSVETVLEVLNGVKTIDLFGPGRIDKQVPLSETLGELKSLIDAGKIGGVGLSEVSASTIRAAHTVVPVRVVEVEFSLWSAEILHNGVADTCRDLGVPIAAYSPLGRGFLTGELRRLEDVPAGDVRLRFERFRPENFSKNLDLVDKLQEFAKKEGVTAAQLALAWIRSHADTCGLVIPIPGATTAQRVEENTKAVELTPEQKAKLDEILASFTVVGHRYTPQMEGMLWG